MKTFQHDIAFLQKSFDASKVNEESAGHIETLVTKTATFKELSRTDREQHELHFAIIDFYAGTNTTKKKTKVRLDIRDALPLVEDCIETLLIPTNDFTAEDKEEFLSDSGALFTFAMWMLKEKLSLFFGILMQK